MYTCYLCARNKFLFGSLHIIWKKFSSLLIHRNFIYGIRWNVEITWPNITSETSVGSTHALVRLSLITTLPKSDAFTVDKEPQNAPENCETFQSMCYMVYKLGNIAAT